MAEGLALLEALRKEELCRWWLLALGVVLEHGF